MLARERVVIAPEWSELLHAHGLVSVAAVYAFAQGEAVTRSGSTEVRRVELSHRDQVYTLFIKKYWANDFKQAWRGSFRGTLIGLSKARREFENLGRLRLWGLDAPPPVAYGEERRFGWLRRSFLISAGVPEPLPLDEFIRDRLPSLPPAEGRAKRQELIAGLAEMLRRLHAHRFVHHDLFWRNILLSGGRLDRFFLIDAHKGRCWRWRGETARAKDLATLDAAAPWWFRRTERLRFLCGYLGTPRLDRHGKGLARQVLRLAEPMRPKQLERVREGRLVSQAGR